MPCEPLIQNGKAVGFICSRKRGKPKPPPCYKMGNDTDYCDEHNNQLAIHKTKQGERVHQQRLKELGIEEGEEQ